MNGFLLKNEDGVLGLIVVDETRDLQGAIYFVKSHRLKLEFANGDVEELATEIDSEFFEALKTSSELFVGHYAKDGFEGDPSKEYLILLQSDLGA